MDSYPSSSAALATFVIASYASTGSLIIARFIFQPLGISTLYFMLSFFHCKDDTQRTQSVLRKEWSGVRNPRVQRVEPAPVLRSSVVGLSRSIPTLTTRDPRTCEVSQGDRFVQVALNSWSP